MRKLIDLILERLESNCFSDSELFNLIEGTSHRRYGLIKRAIAKGEIIHIRRGLYCLAKRYRKKPLNLFAVAQKIYGPSHISLKSALSHHGWIPEGVHTVTSVISQRSRTFETPLGLFDYKKVVCDPLFAGVISEKTEGETFFLAKPLRSLADYIYIYKKDWREIKPLVPSLRVEETMLSSLTTSDFNELKEAFRQQRVLQFLSGVQRDLKL